MTNTKVKAKIISWTDAEHQAILDELQRNELNPSKEWNKLSLIKKVKKTQLVLPVERQKIISGKHHFGSLLNYMDRHDEAAASTPSKVASKRKLVRWTKQECVALAIDIFLNRDSNEKLNLLTQARLAQSNVLTPDRQRPLHTTNDVKKLIPFIEEIKAEHDKQQTQPVRSHGESESRISQPTDFLNIPSQFKPRPAGFSDVFDHFFTSSTHTPTVEQSAAEVIADAIFATMIPKVTELMDEVKGLVSKRLKAFVLEQAKEITLPTSQELVEALEGFEPVKRKVKPELQRVLTLGFKPGGPLKLEDYYKLDVRFCEDQAEIRRVMNDNTIVIQAPKRTSHLNGDIKKKATRIIMVNGGQTELARHLHALNVTLADNKVE